MATDIRPKQRLRAIYAVQRVGLSASNGLVILHVKAYSGFAPSSFDGMAVLLRINENGVGQDLPGHLRVQPSTVPRGVWFTYQVEFVHPTDANRIRFRGECDWSNVKTVMFRHDKRLYAKNYTFFDANL